MMQRFVTVAAAMLVFNGAALAESVPQADLLEAGPYLVEGLMAHGFGRATYDTIEIDGADIVISNLRTEGGDRGIEASRIRIADVTEDNSRPAWLNFGSVRFEDVVLSAGALRLSSGSFAVAGLRLMNDFDTLNDRSEYEHIDAPFGALAFTALEGAVEMSLSDRPLARIEEFSVRAGDWVSLGGPPTRIEVGAAGMILQLPDGVESLGIPENEAFAAALRVSGPGARGSATASASFRVGELGVVVRLHGNGMTMRELSAIWADGTGGSSATFDGLVADARGLDSRAGVTDVLPALAAPYLSQGALSALAETLAALTADERVRIEAGMGARIPLRDMLAGGTLDESAAARLAPRNVAD